VNGLNAAVWAVEMVVIAADCRREVAVRNGAARAAGRERSGRRKRARSIAIECVAEGTSI
jgi:hypothetical protein